MVFQITLHLSPGCVHFSKSLCFQSKEERILELETENAILHLRLAEVRTSLLTVLFYSFYSSLHHLLHLPITHFTSLSVV